MVAFIFEVPEQRERELFSFHFIIIQNCALVCLLKLQQNMLKLVLAMGQNVKTLNGFEYIFVIRILGLF